MFFCAFTLYEFTILVCYYDFGLTNLMYMYLGTRYLHIYPLNVCFKKNEN
jgi:hypothetical protein